jgi:hypothetical protein
MSDQRHEEKELQKRDEKREEKAPEEKNWDEKYRRDPVGMIVWAAILIWAGLVLLAGNLGLLDVLVRRPSDQAWGVLAAAGAWGIVFIGAGIIVLLGIAYRLAVPAQRRPITGAVILAIVLIAIGLGNLTDWNIVWPLIVVAIGLSIVIGAFTRRRR